MNEELTTAQHAEFELSDSANARHTAFAVFKLMSLGMSLPRALDVNGVLNVEQVRPYLEDWNRVAEIRELISLPKPA